MHRSENLPKSTNHVVRQIQPGLWQIEFLYPVSTNCWLLQEDDGLTLIDSGHSWSAANIIAAAEHIGQPLKRIVITHGHPDHAGSASELVAKTGAVVLAHECELPFLCGQRSMAHEPGFLLCRVVLKVAHALGGLNSAPIAQVQPAADGEMIGSLRVMHTPGHTPGSISLWSENAQAIFCGDNLLYSLRAVRVGLPWFTLDHSTQKASLSRYAELPARLLLSGHGPAYQGDVSAAVKRLL